MTLTFLSVFLLANDKGKADYLVSGDTDLLSIKEYKGTKIITIDEFEKLVK